MILALILSDPSADGESKDLMEFYEAHYGNNSFNAGFPVRTLNLFQ